ncbi:PE family protein [Mycobacterium sp. 852002-51057_SCH5723018]|uniref:PE family protein n=1 Tax=Mycobacterium sp. 852002-51057_SCH5723018 TaxID=1834094 RepID=UPI0007FEA9F7|nr:PE family protein [Mycobacterium sp. 852002-51057_SCH5723018]OBG22274.1 hypothetical protein A5764_12630 [Mycobacterium sp. 852002-51057_SCH5723018]
MSFVFATPEYLAAAATDLSNIGSTIGSANAAALAPTSSVLAPGADEVSATIAALFDAHSQAYQALSAQAALFHQEFVNLMTGGAAQYALAEAENASPLETVGQTVATAIATPTQALAQGAAPIGNGAGAVLATGTSAEPGAFGGGGTGAAGQLVGATTSTAGTSGLSPAASFAAGGAAGNGGLIAPGGAGQAVASAEEVGVAEAGETSLATVPASGLTPLAAMPAAAPASSAAAARPATPAYSPAASTAADSAEE